MTQYSLTGPARLEATINLPASKSISNRALIIHALSKGNTLPENLSDCDDTTVIINALNNMPEVIDIRAAGTAMRFMTAYLSVTPGEHVLTGTERMKHRPIKELVDALRYLGADIEYLGEEGYPPLRIKGKELKGGLLEIPGNISSQYITALLMIGPVLKNGMELKLTDNIISRSYIDLTLHTMHDFGVQVDWTDINVIQTRHQSYQPRPYFIENDWSSSSYWYEILALSDDREGRINLSGLIDGSRQGDSVVRYLFSVLGVKTVFEKTPQGQPANVMLKKLRAHPSRLDYDFVNQPDLAQTFVIACALMDMPFHFTGLSTLKIKETDRIKALKTEMRKLGYVIYDANDSELIWDGERCEASMEPIDTYEDHRMAMAFAPAAMKFPGIRINNPQVVSKSYPQFWDHLRQAGFVITEL